MTAEKAIPRWCLHVVACHKPDIVAIHHRFGEDHTGEPCVFFTIIISDEMGAEAMASSRARQRSRCFEITRQAQRELMNHIPFFDLGLLAYFNVQTVSECARLGAKKDR